MTRSSTPAPYQDPLRDRWPRAWHSLRAREGFDLTPTLTGEEQAALTAFAERAARPTVRIRRAEAAVLTRLLTPAQALCDDLAVPAWVRYALVRILLTQMHARGRPFWAWAPAEWVELLAASRGDFVRLHPYARSDTRGDLLALAYCVSDLRTFCLAPGWKTARVILAGKVFGAAAVAEAYERVSTLLTAWGFSPQGALDLRAAVCTILLVSGDPALEAVTTQTLLAVREGANPTIAAMTYCLGRALHHLGIIDQPLPLPHGGLTVSADEEAWGVPPEWLHWCRRWRAAALEIEPAQRQMSYNLLVRCGRWLGATHPDVSGPQDWTTAVATSWVAAVRAMTVGAWVGREEPRLPRARRGTPAAPRTKIHMLGAVRRFFLDLCAEPHNLRLRFDPRVLRAPRDLRHQVGPAPRDIRALTWARLVQAARTLTEDDLPLAARNMYPLALVRAVAIVWCYAGLRNNEIRRLRLPCIVAPTAPGGATALEEAITDGTYRLQVSLAKAGGRLHLRPVNPIVAEAIGAWVAVRPVQPRAVDPMTHEAVDLLFSIRGRAIAPGYLNRHLIPRLCDLAGVPRGDERGRFTSHRARATIATLLYNAPEGLSLPELAAWLGHKQLSSTQHYAAIAPHRLSVAYTRAEENSVLVGALVDLEGGPGGTPRVYTVLEDEALCSNPEWASCPARMACIQCEFHVPRDLTRVVAARASVRQMLQKVALRPDERAALERDEAGLSATIARVQGQRAPGELHRRTHTNNRLGIPLSTLRGAGEDHETDPPQS